MNLIRFDSVIVVEGATDVSLLRTFLDADIVTTNGSDVPRETIAYLQELSKTRTIIVLTDPDFPGKKIRDTLNKSISGLYHAYIPKEKSIKRNKVGVAECDKDTILEALRNACPPINPCKQGTITFDDLLDLGLIGGDDASKKRKVVGEKFHIGEANGKTFLKRANALGLTKEDLKEALQ